MRIFLPTLVAAGVAATLTGQSAQPREIVGHVLKPTERPAPDVAALTGHVVAGGETVGLFAAPSAAQ